MSTTTRLLIGIFIILHGLVHPIMAVVPQPLEEQSDESTLTIGGFWTKSWLLGDGPTIKAAIYALAMLTALVFLATGIGFMGLRSWTKTTWLAGAGLSLLLLIVFWDVHFVVGVVIDVLMISTVFIAPWFTR